MSCRHPSSPLWTVQHNPALRDRYGHLETNAHQEFLGAEGSTSHSAHAALPFNSQGRRLVRSPLFVFTFTFTSHGMRMLKHFLMQLTDTVPCTYLLHEIYLTFYLSGSSCNVHFQWQMNIEFFFQHRSRDTIFKELIAQTKLTIWETVSLCYFVIMMVLPTQSSLPYSTICKTS